MVGVGVWVVGVPLLVVGVPLGVYLWEEYQWRRRGRGRLLVLVNQERER